jgi:DNA-directed RNA polymerase specialized sigma24 family protein
VIDGRAPADVAEELGMTRQALYKAKSRVLRRLRHDLDGLGPDDPPNPAPLS